MTLLNRRFIRTVKNVRVDEIIHSVVVWDWKENRASCVFIVATMRNVGKVIA